MPTLPDEWQPPAPAAAVPAKPAKPKRKIDEIMMLPQYTEMLDEHYQRDCVLPGWVQLLRGSPLPADLPPKAAQWPAQWHADMFPSTRGAHTKVKFTFSIYKL